MGASAAAAFYWGSGGGLWPACACREGGAGELGPAAWPSPSQQAGAPWARQRSPRACHVLAHRRPVPPPPHSEPVHSAAPPPSPGRSGPWQTPGARPRPTPFPLCEQGTSKIQKGTLFIKNARLRRATPPLYTIQRGVSIFTKKLASRFAQELVTEQPGAYWLTNNVLDTGVTPIKNARVS